MTSSSYSAFVGNGIVRVEEDEKHGGVPAEIAAGGDYEELRMRMLEERTKKDRQNAEARHTQLGIDPRRWRHLLWKPTDAIETKVQFILEFDKITSATTPVNIARYLLTLNDMRDPEHLQSMIHRLFKHNPSDVDQRIRSNLVSCSMIDPNHLEDTPFHNDQRYKQLVTELSWAHNEHVRYAVHFRTAVQNYMTNLPMPPLMGGPNVPPPPEPAPLGSNDGIVPKPWQDLLDFIFVQANMQGMRRQSKSVYRPVFSNQNFTRFYVREADMVDWIYQQIKKPYNPKEYDTMTKDKKTMEYLLYHLERIPDERFPFLHVCRTLFSYENGIFNADDCKFYPYRCPLSIDPNSRLGDISKLPDSTGTAQYFEGVILPIPWFTDPNFDWVREINTRSIDKIFQDQDYGPEDMAWVRTFHGRGLHDVIARHDDWQIIVHTKGPGGCGKSVIGKVLKSWYPKERFGVLNDDMQENFPDSHLKEAWVVVCFDASPDFALSPTRFLCWASGDDVTIAQKYKDTIIQSWTAPVFFFSNYEMPVQGGSGSAIRRGLIMYMDKGVAKADGQLLHNAIKEAGFYLIKCTFDYHHKCRQYGKQSLWDDPTILPERFWRGREQYAKASSWQDAFLLSGRFEFGPDFEVSVEAFKCEYANFQQVQKALPGVNRSRKYGRNETRIPPCQPSEFANALRSIRQGRCYWDTERNKIVGLKFSTVDQEPQAAVAAPVVPRLTMSQQRNKRARDAPEQYTPSQPKTPRIDITSEPSF